METSTSDFRWCSSAYQDSISISFHSFIPRSVLLLSFSYKNEIYGFFMSPYINVNVWREMNKKTNPLHWIGHGHRQFSAHWWPNNRDHFPLLTITYNRTSQKHIHSFVSDLMSLNHLKSVFNSYFFFCFFFLFGCHCLKKKNLHSEWGRLPNSRKTPIEMKHHYSIEIFNLLEQTYASY